MEQQQKVEEKPTGGPREGIRAAEQHPQDRFQDKNENLGNRIQTIQGRIGGGCPRPAAPLTDRGFYSNQVFFFSFSKVRLRGALK